MTRIIFSPELIDDTWTIDVVDEDGERYGLIFANKEEAEYVFRQMKNEQQEDAQNED